MSHTKVTVTVLVLAMCIHVGAWAAGGLATPTMSDSYPTRDSLAAFYSAAPVSFSQVAQGDLADIDVLVWACHSRQLPKEATDPNVIANLRHFVERGGGLFLVSFAQAYAVDLGLEPVMPDRQDFFRYGYNDASRVGGYFVVGIKGDAGHPLFKGMTPTQEDSDAFFISGSSHINLENCFWSEKSLQRGQSLGSYFRRNEKGQILDQQQVKLLNLWTRGKGKVLGYGNNLLLEDFWFNQDKANLETFLHNVTTLLSGRSNARIGALKETPSRLHADTYMSPPMFPQVQPHSLQRHLPGLPYIGHWGWHAQIQYQRADRQCVDKQYFKEKMIDEPFRWGANLLEFYAPGMNRDEGFPFIWKDEDPIARPDGGPVYWGGDWAPGWDNDAVRDIFDAAHQRDMLVQVFYHPDPIRWFPRDMPQEERAEAVCVSVGFSRESSRTRFCMAGDAPTTAWAPSGGATARMANISARYGPTTPAAIGTAQRCCPRRGRISMGRGCAPLAARPGLTPVDSPSHGAMSSTRRSTCPTRPTAAV